MSGGHVPTTQNSNTATTSSHADSHEESTTATAIQFPNSATDEYIQLIKNRWSSIRTHFKCRKIDDVLNVRVLNQSENLKKILTSAWINKLQNQVKLQCSLGCILQNKVTHEFRYFHSYATNSSHLFDVPLHIKSLSDLMAAADKINGIDLLEYAKNQRPNSQWIAYQVTNLTFNFSKMPFPKFGSPCHLPIHIKTNRSIMSLANDGHKKYTDNLCFFRSLALSQLCSCSGRCYCLKYIEPAVHDLYNIYAKAINSSIPAIKFRGISMKRITFLEKLFQVKVTVYSLSSNGKASIIRQSFATFHRTLNLCAVKNHFCYIRKIDSFCSCYQCSTCSQCFDKRQLLNRHKRTCSQNQSKFRFSGDYFHPSMSIFDEIKQKTGINVPIRERFYPYRATFDIECYLQSPTGKNLSAPSTSKLSIQSEHELMSIAVCSNIPGFEQAKCIISNGSSDEVVEEFVLYLHSMSDKAQCLLLEKHQLLIERMVLFENSRKKVEDLFKDKQMSSPFHYNSRSVRKVIEKFYNFISELPVIGFNSQKYDLNVMRAPLVRYLLKHDEISFTIKRDNSLKCLKTKKLKFLDILNFIAPGFSYDAFIKAYGCELTKGFFPYEYMTSLDKLQETQLPPHAAFASTLKQTNISIENYEFCQKIWEENSMKSLRDFLMWYNCRDVVPFLEAIEKQAAVYRSYGLDMFKDAVSVPGLATQWLF
jgi:hypothetical protein